MWRQAGTKSASCSGVFLFTGDAPTCLTRTNMADPETRLPAYRYSCSGVVARLPTLLEKIAYFAWASNQLGGFFAELTHFT